MEELIKRLERVIQTGAPDKDGMHPISAETVLEVIKELSEHGTNLAEVGTEAITKQQAIDALRKLREEDIEDYGCEIPEGFNQDHLDRATFAIKQLPPIHPEIVRCEDCKHYRHGLCMKASMCVNKSENGFCDWAERREVTT